MSRGLLVILATCAVAVTGAACCFLLSGKDKQPPRQIPDVAQAPQAGRRPSSAAPPSMDTSTPSSELVGASNDDVQERLSVDTPDAEEVSESAETQVAEDATNGPESEDYSTWSKPMLQASLGAASGELGALEQAAMEQLIAAGNYQSSYHTGEVSDGDLTEGVDDPYAIQVIPVDDDGLMEIRVVTFPKDVYPRIHELRTKIEAVAQELGRRRR